jgi:nicotinamidase-related amidase
MIKRILLRILLVLGLVIAVLALNLVFFNITASRVSEGTPITDPKPGHVALLVIDIQEGTTGTTSALKTLKAQSEPLINRVNRVLEESHKRGELIIYIRTEVVNPLLNILNNTMARGSEGAELDHRLLMEPGKVVVKRKNDSFLGTDLDQILIENNIGKLVLVGLDAGQCVMSTVKAAANRGYSITVVEEAVISKTEELKAQAISEFRDMGVEIITLD